MSDQTPRPSGPHLEPPSKSAELEDTGAQETGTSTSGDEHFSDASEGHRNSDSLPPSGRSSPIPRTRVEVDNDPRHGDVPGTSAYDIREQDAVPDEIEVVPEGSRSRSQSAADRPDRPLTPGGTPVPLTMVEKVDPNLPSYGDIPGTFAYEQRKADAVPDFITKGSESESKSPPLERASSEAGSSTTAVPGRRLSCVDTTSREETELNSSTHERDSSDSLSDSVKRVQDAPGKPAPSCNTGFRGRLTNSESQTSLSISHTQQDNPQRESTLTSSHEDHEINDYGHVGGGKTTESAPFHGDASMDDDFDDFAQGQEDADDDFGDFDDDFQEPQGPAEDVTADQSRTTTQQPLSTPPIPPLIDFDTYQSLPELTAALDDSLDRLFPASKDATSLPPVEPIHDASAIFSTERSLSLWSQLVAPPPLQPQNWVKSRIRRLFLVSLGVPVDLDEILPASKQKKLVLPSIKREGAEEWGSADVHSQSKGKTGERDTSSRNESGSTVTLSQGQAGTGQKPTRRGEPAPPPELDLLAVRRLCVTTDAALQGLTDEELRRHVKELEKVTQLASSVLEYWIKKQEGLVSEREAFEGVIENLVSHARRVRK